jgi:hypothetical protein
MMQSKLLSRTTKLRIYNVMIRPVITYGCESWTLRKKDTTRLEVFERKVLRKITGPVCDGGEWRRRTNQELRQLTRQDSIMDFILTRRLLWAGHVARMPTTSYARRALNNKGAGRRPLGRPRLRWSDEIQKDYGRAQPWREAAQHRAAWRRLAEAKNRRPIQAPRR